VFSRESKTPSVTPINIQYAFRVYVTFTFPGKQYNALHCMHSTTYPHKGLISNIQKPGNGEGNKRSQCFQSYLFICGAPVMTTAGSVTLDTITAGTGTNEECKLTSIS
jgi:hypothetical protein